MGYTLQKSAPYGVNIRGLHTQILGVTAKSLSISRLSPSYCCCFNCKYVKGGNNTRYIDYPKCSRTDERPEKFDEQWDLSLPLP